MSGELERAVVGLVVETLGANVGETPDWLIRPGQTECGKRWQLVQRIYADLTDGMELPALKRRVERRQVDAVLEIPGESPRILEVDESQHFNEYRARTLRHYLDQVRLAFPAQAWIAHSNQKTRLEGGGFGKPKPPLFPETVVDTVNVRSETPSATFFRPSTVSRPRSASAISRCRDGFTPPRADREWPPSWRHGCSRPLPVWPPPR